MSEDVSVEPLSVAEAAEALGVTRDAIHKRINRGTIEYQKGEDGRYFVYVDTSTQRLDLSTDTSKDESKVEALERLIDSQQDRKAFLERVLERGARGPHGGAPAARHPHGPAHAADTRARAARSARVTRPARGTWTLSGKARKGATSRTGESPKGGTGEGPTTEGRAREGTPARIA